jgi:hypothetical protein
MGSQEPYEDEVTARTDEHAVRELFNITAPAPSTLELERMAARAVDAASTTSGFRWPWLGGAIAMAAGAMALFMMSPTPETSVRPSSEPIAVTHEATDVGPRVRQGTATSEQPHLRPDDALDPALWDEMDFLGDDEEDVIGGLGLLSGPSSIEDIEANEDTWNRVLHAAQNPRRPI